MKPLFLIWFIFPLAAWSQSSVLLLKKGQKTIRRFYPGQSFSFFTTEGMPVQGQLHTIVRDSVFLSYYQVVQQPTVFGTIRRDTTGCYALAYSLANIGGLPRPVKNRIIPAALVMGGSAFTVVNLVNSIREKEAPFGKENLPRLFSASGAVAAGVLLAKLRPQQYRLGHTYRLQVVD